VAKFAFLLFLCLVLAPPWNAQTPLQNACIDRCMARLGDPDLERQEIVNLERETVHAIQTNTGTFFRRVYADDFTGTLSHGQAVDKNSLIQAVEDSSAKYDSFATSDIKVRVFQDFAIATCLWTSRGTFRGRRFENQMRSVHVYVNSGSGWHVVNGQTTPLPPDTPHPL
jgi:hypothetical protein